VGLSKAPLPTEPAVVNVTNVVRVESTEETKARVLQESVRAAQTGNVNAKDPMGLVPDGVNVDGPVKATPAKPFIEEPKKEEPKKGLVAPPKAPSSTPSKTIASSAMATQTTLSVSNSNVKEPAPLKSSSVKSEPAEKAPIDKVGPPHVEVMIDGLPVSIDVTKILACKILRDAVSSLHDQGVLPTVAAMETACTALRAHVPLINKVTSLPERLGVSLEVLGLLDLPEDNE